MQASKVTEAMTRISLRLSLFENETDPARGWIRQDSVERGEGRATANGPVHGGLSEMAQDRATIVATTARKRRTSLTMSLPLSWTFMGVVPREKLTREPLPKSSLNESNTGRDPSHPT